MRFSRWCLLSAFGFLAFHSSAALARHGTANASHAQRENAILVVTPDQKAVTLADFAWLSGRWEGQLGAPGSEKQLSAEQQWMPPKNGTMQGFFRLRSEERRVGNECRPRCATEQ